MGHVTVWLAEARYLRLGEEAKDKWQVPVSRLLHIAKVKFTVLARKLDLNILPSIRSKQEQQSKWSVSQSADKVIRAFFPEEYLNASCLARCVAAFVLCNVLNVQLMPGHGQCE